MGAGAGGVGLKGKREGAGELYLFKNMINSRVHALQEKT